MIENVLCYGSLERPTGRKETNMNKTKAVKYIYNNLYDYEGGLPRAIAIYNYLSSFGELELNESIIKKYFNERW